MPKSKYTTMITSSGKTVYRTRITRPDGVRKALYADTVKELDDKVKRLRQQIDEMVSSGSQPYCPTLEEYAHTQLKIMEANVKYGTFLGYKSKVERYIIEPLGSKKLSDITADDIKLSTCDVTPLSPSVCRTVHMLWRRIMGAALDAGYISKDPTVKLKIKSQKGSKERPPLTDEQVEILLSAVKGLRVETFVRLALDTGLRREEILALQWDCVYLDAAAPYISVMRAWRIEHNRPIISSDLKTPSAMRNIPIRSELVEYLRTVKDQSTSDYVVANSGGQPLSYSQWRNLWKQVERRETTRPHSYKRKHADGKRYTHIVSPVAGQTAAHNPSVCYSIPFHATPHQLRHTYVTNLVHKGVDPKIVQYLAGHEDSKITMDVYAHVKSNRPEDIAEILFRDDK